MIERRRAFTLVVAAALLMCGAFAIGSYATAPVEAGSGDLVLYSNATVETMHWATVTGNTTLYEGGDVLTDSPMYLIPVCPVLDQSVTVSLPEEGMGLHVTFFATLYAERDGVAFWTEEYPLIEESVVAGETWSRECALNMSAMAMRVSEVDSELQGSGEMHLSLLLIVEVDGLGTSSHEVPISMTAVAYWVDGDLDHSIIERTTVAGSPVPEAGFPWALAVGAALVVCSALVAYAAWPEGGFEIAERRRKRAYREWVSEGRIPGFRAEANIRVEDLGSLVDIAMDLGKRVIHDRERGLYAVIDTRVVYYFVERR